MVLYFNYSISHNNIKLKTSIFKYKAKKHPFWYNRIAKNITPKKGMFLINSIISTNGYTKKFNLTIDNLLPLTK